MSRSVRYDRAAGYFASSLLAIAPMAFSDFVKNGGEMRLICSPHLTPRDADLFSRLEPSDTPPNRQVVVDSIRALMSGDNTEQLLMRCLSSMVDSKILKIKFVVPTHGSGIFHDKIGIFADSQKNGLSFVGSANETGSAWSGLANHEQFEVFSTWHGPESRQRYQRHILEFEQTWQETRRGLRLTSVDFSRDLVQEVCPAAPLDEALSELRQALSGGRTAQVVHARPLRDYQSAVLKSWATNSNRGIISFATGGGKTLTAIQAIKDWTSTVGPCLVLLPSKLLHDQWMSELRTVLGTTHKILAVGAGNNRARWIEQLSAYTTPGLDLGPRIVVSTYKSAISPDFLARISGGEHLLVVADEVHNIGATNTQTIMDNLDAGGRLGLSATPTRFGDESGTSAICSYFGEMLRPAFTIEDAIEQRVLVPYEYSFDKCSLTGDEQLAWDYFSKKIFQDYIRNNKTLSEHGFILLQQRARIAKSAEAKADIARQILESHHTDGDRWLIYCADRKHLQTVRQAIAHLDIPTLEYHSGNNESHEPILQFFKRQGGVLLAIKCLDEGVDIPSVNKAIILASSTNPREYIQRRGRVLRKSPGKYSASLFDVLLTEESGGALSLSELERAHQFASNARNSASALLLSDLIELTHATRGQSTIDIDFESEETEE